MEEEKKKEAAAARCSTRYESRRDAIGQVRRRRATPFANHERKYSYSPPFAYSVFVRVHRGCDAIEDPFSKKEGDECVSDESASDKIANDDCTEATVSSAQPVCEFGTMCFGGCNKCEQDSDCIQDKPSARTCDTDRNSMTQGFCSSVIGDVCQVRGEFNARGSPPGMGLPGCPEGSRCKNKKDTPFGVCEAEKQVGKAGCTDTTCPDGRMCTTARPNPTGIAPRGSVKSATRKTSLARGRSQVQERQVRL